MAALKEQSMRFKELYPHLFLSDADVGCAAFRVTICDDGEILPMTCSQERIVFNGRTTKGQYKWGPANSSSSIEALVGHFERRGWFCRHGQEEAWKSESGFSRDEHVDGLVTTDAHGNIVISESQMTNWVLQLEECLLCDEDCYICGGSA
eukprot:1945686-Prymnesium_polylepis.2